MPIRTQNITKTALFAAIISISAYIRIPTGPVPLTFQSAAVLITGYCLGHKYGALSTILYTVVGLAGLPVFASGGTGNGYSGKLVVPREYTPESS